MLEPIHPVEQASTAAGGLPVSPSLGPTLEQAAIPTERLLVDWRLVMICLISIILALAAACVAQLLLGLIALITNISFHHQFSFANHPPVFRGAPSSPYRARTEPILSGIAASSGAGEGKVVRLGPSLEGIDRFSPGDVLVLRSLDLGLAPLFVQARAVVSELGTPFSSSAVVARDYGVPAVTGVAFAWSLLREGERVRVDGDAATVESLGT